jgi:hypothetical protein
MLMFSSLGCITRIDVNGNQFHFSCRPAPPQRHNRVNSISIFTHTPPGGYLN